MNQLFLGIMDDVIPVYHDNITKRRPAYTMVNSGDRSPSVCNKAIIVGSIGIRGAITLNQHDLVEAAQQN